MFLDSSFSSQFPLYFRFLHLLRPFRRRPGALDALEALFAFAATPAAVVPLPLAPEVPAALPPAPPRAVPAPLPALLPLC